MKDNFSLGGDIMGLDANVLVDLVESEEFKNEIRNQIEIGVIQLFTTNIALGETRHVLVRHRGYEYNKATDRLSGILSEFNIVVVKHNEGGNKLADEWVRNIEKKLYIHKFSTFRNDCRILANLIKQANINVYITEDRDIGKAVKILKLPINIVLVGEASYVDEFKIKEFFRGNRRFFHKKKRPG